MIRTATLYGCLTGETWMPAVVGTLPVTVDLCREASRFVNATGSGLVDAIRAAVDDAGDFRCARLTADSFVMVEHRDTDYTRLPVRVMYRARRVNVADLPSLAGYVAGGIASEEVRP